MGGTDGEISNVCPGDTTLSFTIIIQSAY
jgi:hypothetical protein